MSFSIRLAEPVEIDEIVRIDEDAAELYQRAGLVLDIAPTHPFAQAERARWLKSAEGGQLFLAVDDSLNPVGFAALEALDGTAHLEQLSVRCQAMRQGLGRSLLRHAIAFAAAEGHAWIWLTTYRHLPWNAPFYEREGFRRVPESECGPGLIRELDEQRRVLPLPQERVAMKRSLGAS